MSTKKTKTYRFSEAVLKKIEDRNRGQYPYETQYLEAAVLAFEGDGNRLELLEGRVEKLEQEFYDSQKEKKKDDMPSLPDIGM